MIITLNPVKAKNYRATYEKRKERIDRHLVVERQVERDRLPPEVPARRRFGSIALAAVVAPPGVAVAGVDFMKPFWPKFTDMT
jgi:hypothetical protein